MKVALLALALGLVQFPVHAADAANAAQLDRPRDPGGARRRPARHQEAATRLTATTPTAACGTTSAISSADDAVANSPERWFRRQRQHPCDVRAEPGAGQSRSRRGSHLQSHHPAAVVDLRGRWRTATGRWRVLGMLGRFGGSATWADSLYRFGLREAGRPVENQDADRLRGFRRRLCRWLGAAEARVPPARPIPRPYASTSRIRRTGRGSIPAKRTSRCAWCRFPYANRGSLRQPANPSALFAAGHGNAGARAADLIRRAQRLADEQSVLNLQRAYGYYVDRGQWRQAADLFAPQGTREAGQAGVYVGREHIRRALALDGPEGLRAGQLNDHLQIEPIVDVAADGSSAQVASSSWPSSVVAANRHASNRACRRMPTSAAMACG